MILAAGASSRFGGTKALALFEGKTLLERALYLARELSGQLVRVVTGGHSEKIHAELDSKWIVHNANWREGMGTSIAVGVADVLRLAPDAHLIVILPVDQPGVRFDHLTSLVRESRRTNSVVLTKGADHIGPPAAVPRNFFSIMLQLEGEQGLKSGLKSAEFGTVTNVRAAIDIDQPSDFDFLNSSL
ncbi:MAG: nucleotidyltransferase family protein [Cryobacterium sp.]|nr:nucleotidyltransferase family protein [Oligoflexia bacterium]